MNLRMQIYLKIKINHRKILAKTINYTISNTIFIRKFLSLEHDFQFEVANVLIF
jgi:hypothetical protein